MTDGITAGSILIEEGTYLPNSLRLQSAAYSSGWAAVKIAHSAFEREVQAAGWTFFFMAGVIKSTVFGFDRQKRLREALARLLTSVKSQHCNSIEIMQVTDKSFLKVPYVTMSAHARHLQKGVQFVGQR